VNKHTRTIAPGVDMPLLGFGTYLIPNADAAAAVRTALDAGYRHVDTAEFYQNEEGVGLGLKDAMKAHGLSRADIFVTTKLAPGNEAWGQTPKTTATTISSMETSLKNLGLDFVDLYLIHAPFQKDQRIAQWRGLVELHRQGKARAIGVSNFNIGHIEELVSAGLPLPTANQIELHPWSQKPALVRFLDDKGITPIAYSSLVPLSTWRTGQASGKTDDMRKDSDNADSPFKKMAAKYGVSEARLLLRWGVQQRWPVLPKSLNRARIVENADLFSFAIDDGDMAHIAKMDRGPGVAWGASDPVLNA
jgi:2,5-diketo-D-gluconate reductase A